jgi:hypothetical protein
VTRPNNLARFGRRSPDDPKHPGWPKGREGGRGGKFRPKSGSEIAPNAANVPSEQLQNTENIIILPTLLHQAVTDEYRRPAPDGSNMTLYEWLQTRPYDVQREIGLKILRELHILK